MDQHKAGGGSKVLAAGAGGRLPGAVYSCVAIADHSSDTRSLAESMRARLSAGMLSAVRGAHRRSRPSNNCEAHQLTARGRDSRDSVHLLVGCGKHNVQRCWTCMRRKLVQMALWVGLSLGSSECEFVHTRTHVFTAWTSLAWHRHDLFNCEFMV